MFNFINDLVKELKLLVGLDPQLIEALTNDIMSLKDPDGKYSLWNLPEGTREYWGDSEWYRNHPLQPILDHWHNLGVSEWIAEHYELDEEEFGILCKSIKDSKKDNHTVIDWENKIMIQHPGFVSTWNAIGIVLMHYVDKTAGVQWFKKNWFHEVLDEDEWNQLLKMPKKTAIYFE